MLFISRSNIGVRETRDRSAEEMVKKVSANQVSRLYTPASEWIYEIIKPMFQDQLPDADTFNDEFDRAEIFLSLLAQDATSVRADSTESGEVWVRSHWVGRAAWRASRRRRNALEEFMSDLEAQGERWRPLQAGLFGGQLHRVEEAMEKLDPAISNPFRWLAKYVKILAGL
ncbi:hypothetical protein [Aeromicrobium sp. P5_D10]